MKNGGAKRIFYAGQSVRFRNPFSFDSVCATLVESVKDGEIKGENVIISDFLPETSIVQIKQVIEPDSRVISLTSLHNVYRYIVECPDKKGIYKKYLLNEIFLYDITL